MCDLEPGMKDPEEPKILCVGYTSDDVNYILPVSVFVALLPDELQLALEDGETEFVLKPCYMTQSELDALPELD